jgi:hypothetical protein
MRRGGVSLGCSLLEEPDLRELDLVERFKLFVYEQDGPLEKNGMPLGPQGALESRMP